MKLVKLFDDFLGMQAAMQNMSREEYTAHYLSEANRGKVFSESIVTEAKFKAGDKWEWKTSNGVKVVKITNIKPNGDVVAREDGTSQDFIVRDADKFLKKKVNESIINEKREDVGKYNTVKKVIDKLGRRPSEEKLAKFITDNYYDVTEFERGEDDEAAYNKIADLVGFYKYDTDDWEKAWTAAQNESVVTEEDRRDTLTELNEMTLGQLERIEDYAEMIADRMNAGQQLESWMFSQITGAVDNLNAVHDAMDGVDGIKESKESDTLAKEINKSIIKIDDSMSYKDFALAVGKILKDEYGSHNYKGFMEVLHKDLGI